MRPVLCLLGHEYSPPPSEVLVTLQYSTRMVVPVYTDTFLNATIYNCLLIHVQRGRCRNRWSYRGRDAHDLHYPTLRTILWRCSRAGPPPLTPNRATDAPLCDSVGDGWDRPTRGGLNGPRRQPCWPSLSKLRKAEGGPGAEAEASHVLVASVPVCTKEWGR